MKTIFYILAVVVSANAFASYRVYQLKIEIYDHAGKKTKERVEVSTLDSLQYEHYHGGFGTMRVTMTDTWYCPGDTSRRKLCDKPKLTPTRGTASTDPKRTGTPFHLQPVIP